MPATDQFLSRAVDQRRRAVAAYRQTAAQYVQPLPTRALTYGRAYGDSSGMANPVLGAAVTAGSTIGYSEESARASDQYRRFHGWTFVAINRIATRVAALPIMVGRTPKPQQKGVFTKSYRKLKEVERTRAPFYVKALGNDVEVLDNHELIEAFKDPNDIMVSWSVFYMTVASLEMTGRAFWWMPRVKGKLQIWPLPSDWCVPNHAKGLFAEWIVSPPNRPTGNFVVPKAEMAYFPLPNPADPLGCVSPVQTQSTAIAADEAIQTAQWRVFKNSIFPSHALRVGRLPGMLPGQEGERPVLEPDQRMELMEEVRAMYEGVVNYGLPLIIDGMVEGIDKLSFGPQEMDFLQSGNIVKSRIFQALGVNPIVAGEIAGVNRAQAAVAGELLCDNVINPLGVLFGQTMTKHYKEEGVTVWLEQAKPGDADLSLRQWQAGVSAQSVTKDEFRANVLGLPPLDEGGDELAGAPAPAAGGFGGLFGPPAPKPGAPAKPPEKPVEKPERGDNAEEEMLSPEAGKAWHKGGAGSGNFGHEGIPGHQGGSAPQGEGGGGGGGGGGGDWIPASTPQWERRRDREEGTQVEADRSVKRADKAVEKARKALDAFKAKVEAEAHEAGKRAALDYLQKRIDDVGERKSKIIQELGESQKRMADLKAQLKSMRKLPKRRRDASDDTEEFGREVDAVLERMEAAVKGLGEIADEAEGIVEEMEKTL